MHNSKLHLCQVLCLIGLLTACAPVKANTEAYPTLTPRIPENTLVSTSTPKEPPTGTPTSTAAPSPTATATSRPTIVPLPPDQSEYLWEGRGIAFRYPRVFDTPVYFTHLGADLDCGPEVQTSTTSRETYVRLGDDVYISAEHTMEPFPTPALRPGDRIDKSETRQVSGVGVHLTWISVLVIDDGANSQYTRRATAQFQSAEWQYSISRSESMAGGPYCAAAYGIGPWEVFDMVVNTIRFFGD